MNFQTWQRLDQSKLTQDIRSKALRCHHLYDIKRDLSAKNRVVVNGSKQHSDTYTDTTSPVAGQMMVRLFLPITAYRNWDMIQLDLTNSYLHAPIKDIVCIIIPEGFPGAGEVVFLQKAAYGTKQGARRFYDFTVHVLKQIGLDTCPNDSCLFCYLYKGSVCYLLQYVDDALISGEPQAIENLQQEMKNYLQCKFDKPKGFLGLDITHNAQGEITLSMHTFTNKMRKVLGIDDDLYGDVLTPGRIDKKVNREDEHDPNDKYRSYVDTLNWLSVGLRYDIAFTIKELSRVLDKPTKIANEIVNRALIYSYRTKDAHLKFSSLLMAGYTPPKIRRKPTDAPSDYAVDHFNTNDGITHVDEKEPQQDYTHPEDPLTLTCLTDIDLAGQPDTRQSTSAYTLYLNGTMFHWRAHTEKLIIKSTASGEYIALSRGNQACKHVREILKLFGNKNNIYYLYTDNQAAEHIAT